MKIETIDYKSNDFPKEFIQSLHKDGFVVIKNHSIPPKLINNVYNNWSEFFDSSEKNEYLFDYHKQDGYFPFKTENAKDYREKDLKEFYHVYPGWGRYPESVNKNALVMHGKLMTLGRILLKYINDFTPKNIKQNFSMPLQNMIDDSNHNLLRIIHYPPIKGNESKESLRAAPHADINLITLLLAGSSKGLQVKSKNGTWYDVDFNENEIIINIGDMLQLCSLNYYPSTIHRVINPDIDNNISRYSMPLFIHPRDEVKLSDKLTAHEYLNQRLKELGLK